MLRVPFPLTPNSSCFQSLDDWENHLISLDEFTQRWTVSRQQLARICRCSLDTVNLWYCRPEANCKREPQLHHRLWLTLADKLWKQELRNR